MADLNLTGMGHTIGWKAGAQLVLMEQARNSGGSFGYTPYSMGNSDNTYQGAPTVDADGKPIAFANRNGKLLETYREVFQSSNPGTFVLGHGIGVGFLKPGSAKDYSVTHLDPNIGDKVRSGELKMPLYNDFTELSDLDRRTLYNLMLAHEGKCRVPIFETWNEAGFDPAKDLLQLVITNPDTLYARPGWNGHWLQPEPLVQRRQRRLSHRLATAVHAARPFRRRRPALYSAAAVTANPIPPAATAGGRPLPTPARRPLQSPIPIR